MDLKTLQTELQRLSQMTLAWEQPDDITAIERELVLARLRDIYEAVRFGLEQDDSPMVVAPVVTEPTERVAEPLPEVEEPQAEESMEEMPLAVDADDFFSLDQILPVTEELAAESTDVEEVVTETTEGGEESLAAEEESVVEVEEEVTFEVEEIEEIEEIEEVEEIEAVEEPQIVAEEELVENTAPQTEEMPIVAIEQEPEVVEKPVVEVEQDVTSEPTSMTTLFGTEPEVDHHRRKQRVIMSLYDAGEPIGQKKAQQPIEQPTPVAEEPEEQIIEVDEEELDDTLELQQPVVVAKPEVSEQPAPVSIEQPVAEAEKPAEKSQPAEPVHSAVVLGEVIKPRQTLADTIKPQTGVGETIRRQPITDLRRAVGLNDKFLLIRDLFGGNGSLYEITIRKLNEFTTFDDCIIYITEHFNWNPNLDGTKLMMDLLERKFDQQ